MNALLLSLSAALALALSGCDKEANDTIVFALSADYPPFEFMDNNALKGFDVELARLVGREMKKEVQFQDMSFSSVLVALNSGAVDAAISTIAMTDERRKHFDFSHSYYEESIFLLYPKDRPLRHQDSLKHTKIACQLGTTMDMWLQDHAPDTEIVRMNSTAQAVEALHAGHVHGVLMDGVQAVAFARENPHLSYRFMATSDHGYGIALRKGSGLTEGVNRALRTLKANGQLDALKKKWLEIAPPKMAT